jgi:hypothetical protein
MDDFGRFFIRMMVLALVLAAVVWAVRGGLYLLNQM